jgi:2-polyprenyl-3-methyl-5-hydroxy-6-metoxy-1,4-benzoquinol methylase
MKVAEELRRQMRAAGRSRHGRVSVTLELVEGKRILDVGCGQGTITARIAELRPDAEVVGVDVLKQELMVAKKAFKDIENLRYELRDVLKTPFPGRSFDCILCLETIEHFDAPLSYVKGFHDMLAPGGSVIISTPNAISLPTIFSQMLPGQKNRLIRMEEKEVRQDTGTHTEHRYIWNYITLARLLNSAGFSYIEHRYANPVFPKTGGTLPFSLGPLNSMLIMKARKKR